jgi:hypothetical protein
LAIFHSEAHNLPQRLHLFGHNFTHDRRGFFIILTLGMSVQIKGDTDA